MSSLIIVVREDASHRQRTAASPEKPWLGASDSATSCEIAWVVEISRCVCCVEEPQREQFRIMVVSHLLSVCEPGQQTDEDGDDLVLDRACDVAVGASKGVSERADNVGAFAAWVAATLGADELGDVFEGDVVGLAQRRESIQVSGEAGATACNPTRYVYPVPGGSNGGPHAGYPAADIFKGNRIDRVDDWSAATDRPRARGGRTVSIRDADGVRHYLSRRLAARHRHESEARCGFGGRSTRTPALIRA